MRGGRSDLRDFWQRLQTGVEVAVAGSRSETLLGVRDGFRRYFQSVPGGTVPVVVVPHPEALPGQPLLVSDESVLSAAQATLEALRREAGTEYDFLVATEGGTHTLSLANGHRVFVRCWTVLSSGVGQAMGSSGSVEIPARLLAGLEEPGGIGHLPGTRREGGLIASLTGGLETRRAAIGEATFHALASLLYGVVEGRPVRWTR